jgi:hypothetical protein
MAAMNQKSSVAQTHKSLRQALTSDRKSAACAIGGVLLGGSRRNR